MRGSAGSATDSRGHAPGEAFAGVAFAAERRPWQRSLNWETPRPGRRRLVVAVLAAVVATLLELSGFDALMRGRVAHERRAPASAPIVVRLEDLLPEPPPEMQPSSRMPASAITRTTARTAPGAERPRRPHRRRCWSNATAARCCPTAAPSSRRRTAHGCSGTTPPFLMRRRASNRRSFRATRTSPTNSSGARRSSTPGARHGAARSRARRR